MISIRRRLLAWLLGGTALAVAAGTVSTFLMAREEANSLADYQLQQMALSFRDHALASGLIAHDDDPARGFKKRGWGSSPGREDPGRGARSGFRRFPSRAKGDSRLRTGKKDCLVG